MASEALPAGYLNAGREYLTALRSLGLHPEFLGWGRQKVSSQWMLVMVTAAIEIGGPLALTELLFKAHNLRATPAEISPFIVRVFGARTIWAPKLRELANVGPDAKITNELGQTFSIESIGQDIADLHLESRDAYLIPPERSSREKSANEWRRFKKNVDRLAA